MGIATGISKAYIWVGLHQFEQSKQIHLLLKPKRRQQARRIRQPGGGRKLVEVKDPSILTAIENILENDIAGDPMTEKKWVRWPSRLSVFSNHIQTQKSWSLSETTIS